MTRHRFDPFSALAGLLTVALAAAIGLRSGPLGLEELQLAGPIAIAVLGIALLASGGREPSAVPTAPTSQPERDQHGSDGDPWDRGEPEGDSG